MAKYKGQNKNGYNSATWRYSQLNFLVYFSLSLLRCSISYFFTAGSIICEHFHAIKCCTTRNNTSGNIFIHKSLFAFLINPLRKIHKVDFLGQRLCMIHVGGGAGNKLCFKSIDELRLSSYQEFTKNMRIVSKIVSESHRFLMESIAVLLPWTGFQSSVPLKCFPA